MRETSKEELLERLTENQEHKAKKIVEVLIDDLIHRKGYAAVWYDTDLDIRNQIENVWKIKVKSILASEE
jgi:hypothetical protein